MFILRISDHSMNQIAIRKVTTTAARCVVLLHGRCFIWLEFFRVLFYFRPFFLWLLATNSMANVEGDHVIIGPRKWSCFDENKTQLFDMGTGIEAVSHNHVVTILITLIIEFLGFHEDIPHPTRSGPKWWYKDNHYNDCRSRWYPITKGGRAKCGCCHAAFSKGKTAATSALHYGF